jgi:hypothetical protein
MFIFFLWFRIHVSEDSCSALWGIQKWINSLPSRKKLGLWNQRNAHSMMYFKFSGPQFSHLYNKIILILVQMFTKDLNYKLYAMFLKSFFSVLDMEPRTSCKICECSTTELHAKPCDTSWTKSLQTTSNFPHPTLFYLSPWNLVGEKMIPPIEGWDREQQIL